MRINRISFALLMLVGFCLQAQEQLVPLKGSSVLMQAWRQKQGGPQMQKAQSGGAAYLPFFDDFSYEGPYPDPQKWVSSTSVFVNHTKATEPITLGVATFDGLKANGYPYNAAATTGSIDSDTLTSIPLRLDSSSNGQPILPTDSIVLRFYYQARGVWEKPDNGDDLILEFYNVPSNKWDPIWSKGGYNPFSDNSMHRVMVVIDSSVYMQNGFQFRFRNKSTGCGDVDHWHIDGVFLDKNISPKKDTIVPEIAFTHDLESILKNYSQMPYEQFTGVNDMKTAFDESNNLRNNFNQVVQTTTYYEIRDNAGTVVAFNPAPGTNNVPMYGTGGYCSDPSLISPGLNSFVYNGGAPFADSTSYLLKFYATQNSDNYHGNDTIYYHQKFHNYFAYDDGSAEAGYGVTANGAATVVKFKLNNADSLQAVDIFFDPVMSVNLLQNTGIKIRVWDDNNGVPGAMRADSAFWAYPVFSTNKYDEFQRYQLVSPLTFTAGATFYIGVVQTLSLSLNIGYDLNNDSHTNVLFNTGSGWTVSSFPGSLMMRPVFGDPARAVDVKNTVKEHEEIVVYPNPATNEVFVKVPNGFSKVSVCDMLGNILTEGTESRLSTADLPSGLYLVKTFTKKGYCDIQKLLIAR